MRPLLADALAYADHGGDRGQGEESYHAGRIGGLMGVTVGVWRGMFKELRWSAPRTSWFVWRRDLLVVQMPRSAASAPGLSLVGSLGEQISCHRFSTNHC